MLSQIAYRMEKSSSLESFMAIHHWKQLLFEDLRTFSRPTKKARCPRRGTRPMSWKSLHISSWVYSYITLCIDYLWQSSIHFFKNFYFDIVLCGFVVQWVISGGQTPVWRPRSKLKNLAYQEWLECPNGVFHKLYYTTIWSRVVGLLHKYQISQTTVRQTGYITNLLKSFFPTNQQFNTWKAIKWQSLFSASAADVRTE